MLQSITKHIEALLIAGCILVSSNPQLKSAPSQVEDPSLELLVCETVLQRKPQHYSEFASSDEHVIRHCGRPLRPGQ
jgi:hypothetical protein